MLLAVVGFLLDFDLFKNFAQQLLTTKTIEDTNLVLLICYCCHTITDYRLVQTRFVHLIWLTEAPGATPDAPVTPDTPAGLHGAVVEAVHDGALGRHRISHNISRQITKFIWYHTTVSRDFFEKLLDIF